MEALLYRALGALDRAELRYLIVGGIAVVLHGHLRATADLDLIVNLTSSNLVPALRELKREGFLPVAPIDPLDFSDPQKRESWKRDKQMIVFSLWHPEDQLFKLDLFIEEPLDFDQAWDRRVRVLLERMEVSVVSLQDLIVLKRAAGRPQDLADLDALDRLE